VVIVLLLFGTLVGRSLADDSAATPASPSAAGSPIATAGGSPAASPVSAPANGSVLGIVTACPAGFDPANKTVTQLVAACNTPLAGVTVSLTTVGTTSSQQTGSDGTAAWDDVAPGIITLTEDTPGGYGPPVVACSYVYPAQTDGTPAGGGNLIRTSGAGGLGDYSLRQGESLVCSFFHAQLAVPTATPIASPTANPIVPTAAV
jgi:hypothetical protein